MYLGKNKLGFALACVATAILMGCNARRGNAVGETDYSQVYNGVHVGDKIDINDEKYGRLVFRVAHEDGEISLIYNSRHELPHDRNGTYTNGMHILVRDGVVTYKAPVETDIVVGPWKKK